MDAQAQERKKEREVNKRIGDNIHIPISWILKEPFNSDTLFC